MPPSPPPSDRHASVIRLTFDEAAFSLVVPHEDGSQTALRAPLVAARAYLRHAPPRASELEGAIAEIEDALMPLLPSLPSPRILQTDAPEIRAFANRTSEPLGSTVQLPTSAVEALFNDLVDVASGVPASHRDVPTDPGFALTLLVLREVLQHGDFDAVNVQH